MPRPDNKPIPQLSEKDIARFWARVDKTPGQGPKGECWPCIGTRTGQGYGQFYAQHTLMRMHRVAYFLETGRDLGPDEGCHSCDWEPCCRPDHIHPGTRLMNAREAVERGLYASGDRSGARQHPESLIRGDNHWARRLGVSTKGEANGFSRFTTEQVIEMRRLRSGGMSYPAIARFFHTTRAVVCGIYHRRTWKHVP